MSDNLIIVPKGIKWLANSALDGATGRPNTDQFGLLTYDDAAHKLGARPPVAYALDHDWKDTIEGLDAFASVGCRRCGQREWMNKSKGCPGLALIVDGTTIPEACDHLARRLYFATDEFYREMWTDNYDPRYVTVKDARDLAEWACSADLLSDDDGNPAGGLGTLLEW